MRALIATLTLSCLAGCAATSPTRSHSLHAADQTPTERYEAYRTTLEHAEVLEEVLFLSTDAVRLEMAKTQPEYRKALLADMQQRPIQGLDVVEQVVSGDQAWLTVQGIGVVDPLRGLRTFGKGKVSLLREHGIWQVDEETWYLEGEDTSGITPRDWAVAPKPKSTSKTKTK
jgi:hypothetical protein